MKLEDTTIYPFIRNDPALCELHTFARGKYIIRSGDAADTWCLINGKVQVEATTQNGEKLMVDTICEDNYVGHLSNFWGQNFYCDSYALVSSVLIRIPKERFLEMMETLEFSRHFYNLLDRFSEDGVIKRLDDGDIEILDLDALYKVAEPVVNFCYNKM